MPDRDVYNRNVERGWQATARHIYEGDDDGLTLPALLRSLGRTLKDGGCPGINEITSIVATALASSDPRAWRREATAQLERVRRACGSTRTEIAVEVACRILADPEALFPTRADRQDRDRAKLGVAEAALVELAIRKASRPDLTHELVEKEHKPIALVLARRRHARDLLASAPQLTKLAQEVLDQPEGRAVKVPRVKTPKPAHEDVVFMAISA